MKRPQLPEIDAKRFYMIGKFAFFTMALIGCIRILDLWGQMKSYDVFSAAANAIFYFVLSAFFSGLQKKEDVRELDDSDIFQMSKALDELNLDGGKTQCQEEKKSTKKKMKVETKAMQ